MIIKTFVLKRKDGVEIYNRKSDTPNTWLHKIGTDNEYYDSVNDIEPCPFQYEEVSYDDLPDDFKITEIEE